MLFLCDVHIPPRLTAFFRAQGHEAMHVYELGLETESDRAIWNYARERDAIIVSKDQDFVELDIADPGPRVILVCIGNCTNRVLVERFSVLLPEILSLFEAGNRLVELR